VTTCTIMMTQKKCILQAHKTLRAHTKANQYYC